MKLQSVQRAWEFQSRSFKIWNIASLEQLKRTWKKMCPNFWLYLFYCCWIFPHKTCQNQVELSGGRISSFPAGVWLRYLPNEGSSLWNWLCIHFCSAQIKQGDIKQSSEWNKHKYTSKKNETNIKLFWSHFKVFNQEKGV